MKAGSIAKVYALRAGETASWLTTLDDHAEDPGSVPSTHMTAQEHL